MIAPKVDPIGVADVERLVAWGFDYVELSLAHLMELDDRAFEEVRRRVEGSGLPCEACNNFFPGSVRLTGPQADPARALDYAAAALSRAAAIGARVVVFGSSVAKNVPPGFPHDEARAQIVALLRHVGPLAAARGITIAIEALNRLESNIVNLLGDAVRLAGEVDHPSVRVLIDSYHYLMEREAPGEITAAAPLAHHVHVARGASRGFPIVWDAGLPEFFATLRSAGYDGRCSIEAYTDSLADDAPRALALLRKHVGVG